MAGQIGRLIGRALFGGAKAAGKVGAKAGKNIGKQVGKTNKYGQRVFKRQIVPRQANGYESYQMTTLNHDGSVASKVNVERSYGHSHIVKETPIQGSNARNKTEIITTKRGADYSRPQSYDNYRSGHTLITNSTYDPKTKTVTKETSNISWVREPETGGVNKFQEGTLRVKF